jgi:hypothetical protein
MNVLFEYLFHPVGQGLFSSSALRLGDVARPFRWVFDCGTTSSDYLLEDALAHLKRKIAADGGPDRLNVVAVSHFDNDHVSGLVRLLTRFDVEDLLLPYLPPWQRLVLAVAEQVEPDQPLLPFLLDPVAFIAGLAGERQVRRIIFVPPAGGEPAPPVPDPGPPDPRRGEDFPIDADRGANLEIDHGKAPDDWAGDPAAGSARRSDAPEVVFLRQGGRLRIRGIWEFVPYNDAEPEASATALWKVGVERERDRLAAGDPDEKARALDRLKALYVEAFGMSSKARNLISLFLYAGPLFGWRFGYLLALGQPIRAWLWGGVRRIARRPLAFDTEMRPGQLFTGDGYLESSERLDRLRRFLGRGRLTRAGILQVMHHGSRHNWHPGVAAGLDPDISVFSSDPGHKRFRHPHRQVVRDFRHHGPMQVDRSEALAVFGLLVTR